MVGSRSRGSVYLQRIVTPLFQSNEIMDGGCPGAGALLSTDDGDAPKKECVHLACTLYSARQAGAKENRNKYWQMVAGAKGNGCK